MITIVLDEKTASTPIGDVLRTVTDPVVEIRAPSGELVAKMLLTLRSGDVTTAQLLARLNAL